MDRQVKVFECICYDANHLMAVTRWWDDDRDANVDDYEWDELSLEIQAHYQTGFFGRIWQGMKYVWNPEDGCFWSGTCLSKESAKELIEVLTDYYNGVKPE